MLFRNASSEDKHLGTLCQETLDGFKQCLEYDLQTFKENSDNRVASILSGEKCDAASEEVLFPPDVLLKLTALSILSSHSLRQLGGWVLYGCSTVPSLPCIMHWLLGVTC